MNGGGGIFGKMREGCDQEYAYKMEIIEDILNDFQELLRLVREFPYLNVTYNREIHTKIPKPFLFKEIKKILR